MPSCGNNTAEESRGASGDKTDRIWAEKRAKPSHHKARGSEASQVLRGDDETPGLVSPGIWAGEHHSSDSDSRSKLKFLSQSSEADRVTEAHEDGLR